MSAFLDIDEILISVSPGETRAALLAGGRLVELIVARESHRSLLGNVYLGRLSKPAPGANAAFVELGEARAGFLSREDAKGLCDARGALLARAPSEGEAVLVQLTQDAFGRKGPRVTGTIALAGHWLVLTPTRHGIAVSRKIADVEARRKLEGLLAPELAAGEGLVVRTAAATADGAALAGELVRLRERWRKLLALAAGALAPALLHTEGDVIEQVLRDHGGPALKRVLCDRREAATRAAEILARQGSGRRLEVALHQGPSALFAEYQIDEQIAAALEPVAPLPSGGSLAIGTLEALSAIDVNTARQTGSASAGDARLAVNLEAAGEVARQVRLRNLAGLIVVDFVHMDGAAERARVADALANAFAGDPAGVQLAGFTSLGLFELTRRRLREPLSEALAERCAVCGGEGRHLSAATVAYEVLRAVERTALVRPAGRIRVVAAAAVIAALEGEAKAARQRLEGQLAGPLVLSAGPGYRHEQYDIVTGAAASA